MQLHDLRRPQGANKRRKRVGRGESSGSGKTAGRGGKGQTARTGKGKPGLGFEGGQMPMYRRMPKRGFVNKFAVPTEVVNLDFLTHHFAAGDAVSLSELQRRGLARRTSKRLRVILGRTPLATSLQVEADHFSATAAAQVEAAGGAAKVVGAVAA